MSFVRAGGGYAACAVLLGSVLALAATTVSVRAASPSEPSREEFSAERLQDLHTFMERTVASGQYLGAVTLIARHGRIVSLRAHGRREIGAAEPMRTDAIFRIYSMTKPIASVAALMLMEQGKFQLDDPVSKYLPEFAEVKVFAGGTAEVAELRQPKRAITVRHLLIHAAGFATGGGTQSEAVRLLERAELQRATDLQGYVSKLAKLPLAADPGARFNYDGVQTVVLSRLIEIWSGQPFDEFLKEHIFTPLRMRDTGFTVPTSERHRLAQMTSTDAQGKLIPAPAYANAEPGAALNAHPSAAGGLYSTATDYLRFAQMLLDAGELNGVSILSPKTVSLMMSNQLGNLDPPQLEFRPGEGFGLGGFVATDPARRGRLGSVGEFGWSGAASTYFTIDRREGLVAMLLMQHLPQGLPQDPPRLSGQFYNLVYQSLVQ
jgi:CubicO group peptidase (beta-lactamase class C family)